MRHDVPLRLMGLASACMLYAILIACSSNQNSQQTSSLNALDDYASGQDDETNRVRLMASMLKPRLWLTPPMLVKNCDQL